MNFISGANRKARRRPSIHKSIGLEDDKMFYITLTIEEEGAKPINIHTVGKISLFNKSLGNSLL